MLTVFDSFSGCGGLSIGLRQAGLDVLWANDIWAPASDTYRAAHKNNFFKSFPKKGMSMY